MPSPNVNSTTSQDVQQQVLNAPPSLRSCHSLSKGWQYRSSNSDIWQPAQDLPTSIHLDLLANNSIPDPFLGNNEGEVQWVGRETWVYRTSFEVPENASDNDDVSKVLVFEGLDTYATVKLNNQTILESDNMFLEHRIDISKAISNQRGPHLLEISFADAERKGDEEVAQHPEHSWTTFNSGAARLATRKAQFHYGWDWGPKLMTCGPWKPIYLETFRSRISDLFTKSTVNDDFSEAQLDVSIETEGEASHVVVNVEHDGFIVASQIKRLKSSESTSISINIKSPKLWWPHTFGPQNFYHVNATIYGAGQAWDSVTKRIGLRKVELVRKPFVDQDGTSFYLKINHKPLFAAGSNWIPGDMFAPRISAERYRKWIQMARDSNQVMVRVWGGGIYEPEVFYDACDELGIMVWQDLMLACGMFPAYPSFCEKFVREAMENMRKLRHHPSIAIWCANNEDYIIPLISNIEYDADQTDPKAILESPFPARYIYEHLLPDICARLVPDVPYWPGSPFGGAMPNSVEEGDCHQWHVWHLEKFPYQDYSKLTARFVSEFGMQGMPCMRTVREFFPTHVEENARRDWPEDEHIRCHNKCEGGIETLHDYCEANLNFDRLRLKDYVYVTQLTQSEAVATAYRSWRREWRGPGKEYCGGALVWQLNDCYPVTSWALADYKLRPKMAYWAMKRENRPITASLQRKAAQDSTTLEAWAVNTSPNDIVVDVSLRAWDVRGGQMLFNQRLQVGFILKANQSTEIGNFDLATLNIAKAGHYQHLAFALNLTAAASFAHPGETKVLQPGSPVYQHVNFHEPLKEVPFAQPASFKLRISSPGSVEISSDTALKGVCISFDDEDPRADSAIFEDNGFDLVPGLTIQLGIEGLKVGEEHRLKVDWLGGGWQGSQRIRNLIRPSL